MGWRKSSNLLIVAAAAAAQVVYILSWHLFPLSDHCCIVHFHCLAWVVIYHSLPDLYKLWRIFWSTCKSIVMLHIRKTIESNMCSIDLRFCYLSGTWHLSFMLFQILVLCLFVHVSVSVTWPSVLMTLS